MKNIEKPICFFCMEYALNDDSGSYAGGLGILAGDYLLEAADQGLPIIAIGLRYGKNKPDGFIPLVLIDVPIENRTIKVKVWQKNFKNSVTLLLLDSNVKENSIEDQMITSRIYDSDFYTRLKQEIILGIGGVRVLKQFNITPHVYHLNEGHTAFAALAIQAEDAENKNKIVSTKHTIFSNAGSQISRNDFDRYVRPYCEKVGLDPVEVYEKGKFELNHDMFATTKFMINSSKKANGVSALHSVYEKKVHPHSTLIPITNGVYKKRWQAGEWGVSPEELSDDELWKIKNLLRLKLVKFVEKRTGIKMNPDICTAVWARRFAAYKRPGLLFSDLEMLKRIVSSDRPIQFIISGKAHPDDRVGQEIVERIKTISHMAEFKGLVAYVPNYDIVVAKHLNRGADIWINTPELGKEACGTSGIKASMNGSLQCSVADGWVDEVDWSGKGWILSPDNTRDDLYRFLSGEIADSFYEKNENGIPTNHIRRMKETMKIVDSNFTASRMLKDYIDRLY